MSERYHEHYREILSWPWKLFCAKWERLIIYVVKEARKRAEQEREQNWAQLEAQHKARMR